MYKMYTEYHGTSEIEHGLCACTVDILLAKARGISPVQAHKPCSVSHIKHELAFYRQDMCVCCVSKSANVTIVLIINIFSFFSFCRNRDFLSFRALNQWLRFIVYMLFQINLQKK